MFTLPAEIADIAYQNKSVIYDLLFKASAETMIMIAADPKHLGARIGITAVLHTWGSAMTHHPHVHMIVPGGGISPDGSRWISCRPSFFLPVLVLSKLFRRLFLEKFVATYQAGKLKFFGAHTHLADPEAFRAFLAPLMTTNWFVYGKKPFAGPKAVLAYLSRYTHRVAISNRRLIAADERAVTFKVKDYRVEGPGRYTTMTLETPEFIRRFLMHDLPKGLHRIRHYGLFANGARVDNVERARQLLAAPPPTKPAAEPSRPLLRLPLLRRPHAHHRDLRTRQSAPLSPNSTDSRHQDRHLMSRLSQNPRRKLGPHQSPFAGHDGTRTNRPNKAPMAHRSSPSAAPRHQHNTPIMPTRTLHASACSHRSPPHAPSAAPKSP